MTEPTRFFYDRTAEIIAAYGADPARWPDAERVTALGVVAHDATLTAALTEARELDGDLARWATRRIAPGDAAAMAAFAMRRPRSFVGWAAGGSIAASVAAALVLLTPTHRSAPAAVPAMVAVSDETAFAQVFTPTPDEERIL